MRQEFDAELARKLARRDTDAAEARLAEADADRRSRRAAGATEGVIRVECSLKFSA